MSDHPKRQKPLALAAGQGQKLAVLGLAVTVKDFGRAAGAAGLVEISLPPYYRGLPAHWHARSTEVFYVLNGTLAFTLGKETFTVGRGSAVYVPPGVVHLFWNPVAAPASCLVMCSPSGLQACWAALAGASGNGLPDAQLVWEIGKAHDLFPPEQLREGWLEQDLSGG